MRPLPLAAPFLLSETFERDAHMDRALSLLISAGIAAFGVWIIGYTIASGSPSGWTLAGVLSIILGSISLYQAVGEVRLA
jgi:hypothetical protein